MPTISSAYSKGFKRQAIMIQRLVLVIQRSKIDWTYGMGLGHLYGTSLL